MVKIIEENIARNILINLVKFLASFSNSRGVNDWGNFLQVFEHNIVKEAVTDGCQVLKKLISLKLTLTVFPQLE